METGNHDHQDRSAEPDFTNRPRDPNKFSRFSVIDAYLKRVAIKERHPEHPTLTADALHILEEAEKQKKKGH